MADKAQKKHKKAQKNAYNGTYVRFKNTEKHCKH